MATNKPGTLRRFADWVDIYLSGVRQLLAIAAPHCSGRLLDVGCGRKPYADIFEPYVSNYVGIEHAGAFALTNDSSDAVADHVYDGGALPFEDATFDSVVSFSMLEHTPDPFSMFREMNRVLRPGGTMVQHVPFAFRMHEEPYDFYRFTKYALTDLCARNDLDVIEIRPQGTLWSVLAHKIVTFLAFRVGRILGVAQRIGKVGMEGTSRKKPRYFATLLVAPIIVFVVACARILEKVLPIADCDDCLAFMLIARKRTE